MIYIFFHSVRREKSKSPPLRSLEFGIVWQMAKPMLVISIFYFFFRIILRNSSSACLLKECTV